MKLPVQPSSFSPRNVFTAEDKKYPLKTEEPTTRRCDLLNGFCYQEYSHKSRTSLDRIEILEEEGFFFIYCWAGHLKILKNASPAMLEPFQSALIFKKENEKISVELGEQKDQRFSIICFRKTEIGHKSSQNLLYHNFKESFFGQLPSSSSFYIGPPNLKLPEKINQLSNLSKSDFASELIMEGIILQVFGLKIEQMLDSLSVENKDYGLFSKAEMNALHSVSDFIRKNPELEYSIDFLCRKTGLSPSKLQDGFKGIHGRTVIDFIRNVRLEKSLELIQSTDMNISEIVYSIGLTSRSYFSKIFKKKYKFSPKALQERYRMAV